VIRDYKFDPAFADRPRKRGRSLLLVLAALALPAVVGAIMLNAPEESAPAAPLGGHEPLPVPQTQDEIGAPAPVSLPLELPPVSHAAPAAPVAKPAAELPRPTSGSPSLLQLPAASQPLAVEEAETPQTAMPEPPQEPPLAEPAAAAAAKWQTHKIRSGESLAKIFKARALSPTLLHRIVNSSKQAAGLAKIRPGQELKFLLDEEGELIELVLVRNPVESLRIKASDDSFVAEEISKAVESRIASATGTIESSLFVDAQKAGLSDAQIMELAALFGWDIDFALEIRSGDQFRVVFEEQFLDGKKYRNGPILAAEFVNQGNTHQAFRFEDNKGEIGYYDGEGRNKRRAFIRTPIKFARISSRFNPNRLHPVLKTKRPHRGVDYAAPTGTPIKATGAGKVIFRGWKGGYGRVVIVQHANKYQTLYAHMSKFAGKAKAGKKVKQGQIIGYVGKSGLASGPHLHYEFRVNGVHRNPLTVKLPKSLPLPDSQLAAFKQQTAPLVTQLASIRQATMVASNQQ